MCDLIDKKPLLNEYVGWKIVVDLDGEYYSPAMGIQYVSGRQTKIPRKQNDLIGIFVSDILSRNTTAYSDLMRGRTAIFLDKRDAIHVMSEWQSITNNPNAKSLKLVKAKVHSKCLLGRYEGADIAAGRIITFIDEEE